LGYVPLAETACELMFQVIADRAEKAAVIVTTNLPFCCGSAGAASTTNRSPRRKVWAMDVTYFPMARGFVYLAAVVDWFSRRVLAWRVSISMEVDFCLEAVEEALARHGKPSIFNTDHARERIVKMQRVDPPHDRQLGLVSSPILA
jgi:transposase InsO family protein